MSLVYRMCLPLFVVSMAVACSASPFSTALTKGASINLRLLVADEQGVPVNGAVVDCRLGMFDESESRSVRVNADERGCALIEGKTCGNYIDIVAACDGYYQSRKKLCLIKIGHEYKVENGYWQPSVMEERIVLRKKVDATDLLSISCSYEIPVTNQWCAFDLAKKDWVKPNGVGEIGDFDVMVEWDSLPPHRSSYAKIEVRFANDDAGFYPVAKSVDSVFKGVHKANALAAYAKSFACSRVRKEGEVYNTGFDGTQVYVCRSRCRHDENGKLIGAHYSLIEGVGVFPGWEGRAKLSLITKFNTTFNDLRLESKE